jgi:hypothetical protein
LAAESELRLLYRQGIADDGCQIADRNRRGGSFLDGRTHSSHNRGTRHEFLGQKTHFPSFFTEKLPCARTNAA